MMKVTSAQTEIKQNESSEEGIWRTYQRYPRKGDI